MQKTYQQPGCNQGTRPLLTRAYRPPNYICSKSNQVVILVRDRSGSMEGQKAKDASAACQSLVDELSQQQNKDGFHVAVVDFASSAAVIHKTEKATSLTTHLQGVGTRGWRSVFGGGDANIGGSTNITDGLAQARQALEQVTHNPPSDGVTFLRPVVILFTDGGHNEGPDPASEADRVKQIADLVTVAFGSDADEAMLANLATSPQHFYRCSTGRDLRQFLAAVGATLSQTMAQKTNATRALASVQAQ
jgi:uncharacterized protein YegL